MHYKVISMCSVLSAIFIVNIFHKVLKMRYLHSIYKVKEEGVTACVTVRSTERRGLLPKLFHALI